MCVILGVRQVPSTISRVYGGWEFGEGVPCSVFRVPCSVSRVMGKVDISLSIIGISILLITERYR